MPYRPKTDTLIVLNSTTKNPEGLYADMDKQWTEFLKTLDMTKADITYDDLLHLNPANTNENIQKIREQIKHHYFLLEFDYLWGLSEKKIYTQKEIDEVKDDRTFPGEFCLQYEGLLGNIFSPLKIDIAVTQGEQFKDLPVNHYVFHGCGVDPGFGSSKTAIVLTERLKEQDKIRVLYAEEFERPNPEEIADLCFDLHRKCQNTWFFVDGANAGFITQLKIHFGESLDWQKTDVSPQSSRVIPVNFNSEHKQMLSHLYLLINKEYLAIPQKHDKLILSLRTAIAKEYVLDKEQTSYDDLLDALRLSLKGYKMN